MKQNIDFTLNLIIGLTAFSTKSPTYAKPLKVILWKLRGNYKHTVKSLFKQV